VTPSATGRSWAITPDDCENRQERPGERSIDSSLSEPCDERVVKRSTRPERPPQRAKKELLEGPSRLGLAILMLANILILGGLFYVILGDRLFGTSS